MAAFVVGGCAAPKSTPATPAPHVELAETTYLGTVLGPTTQTAPQPADDAVGLDVSWFVMTKLPAYSLLPLDAQSSLTSAPLSGNPVLTAGRQTRRARFGSGEAADDLIGRVQSRRDGAARQIGHQILLAGPGAVARFRCDLDGQRVVLSFARPAVDRTAATGRTAGVSTTSSPTSPDTQPATTPTSQPRMSGTVTVGLRGFPGDTDSAANGVNTDALETAWLDDQPLTPGSRFALLVPCRTENGPWTVLAAYVDVTDATSARRLASTRPSTRPAPATVPTAERATLDRAAAALKTDDNLRPAMLFLSTSTNATVAADSVVVADGPMLTTLKNAIAAAYAAVPPSADSATIGWALDRAVLLALAGEGDKGTLPPELAAVLVVRAGEVGRHSDSVAGIARSVANAADFQARLVAENYIALEDNSPAARVRAFDWLIAAGRAPADYDPLADARSRRRAINRALESTGGSR